MRLRFNVRQRRSALILLENSPLINGLTNSTAIPVLERLMQFAGQRHRIITNNIANLSTPGFRPADVSVTDFQRQMAEAIDQRRNTGASTHGDLKLASTSEVAVSPDGMTLRPRPSAENIMFHDENDRDVERTMQGLVENFMTFRATAQLLRSRYEALGAAIRERI